jgi:uncharacterized protein
MKTSRPQPRRYGCSSAFLRSVFLGLLTAKIVLLQVGLPAAAQPENSVTVNESIESTGASLASPRWSPYVVGLGIGVLSWLAFLLSHHPIGVSTAYGKTMAMVERTVGGDRTVRRSYYQEHPPGIDWEWMLVAGLFVGALVSAHMSGDFSPKLLPERWKQAFGLAPLPRVLTAMAGGILIGIGARWAGGCTSGHGISGTLQLAVSSWVALLCFFAGGVATAFVLYGVFGS